MLHDFGLQGVELELRTAEEHFPLANPYVISLYLEEKTRWNVEFTGVAANLTNFFPMTAPESDPKRQIAEAGVKKSNRRSGGAGRTADPRAVVQRQPH